MKPSVILPAFVAIAGLSFGAGGYFAPAFFHRASGPVVFNPSSASSVETAAPGAVVHPAGPGTSASVPGDLAAILKEANSYQMLRDMMKYADGLSAADMPQVVEQTQKLAENGNGNRIQALHVLVGRWMELDPKSALAEAKKPQNIIRRGAGLVSDVFSALAVSDPDGAMSEAQQLPAGRGNGMPRLTRSSARWPVSIPARR